MLSKITLLCYLKYKSKAAYQGESGTMAASDKMHSSETRRQLISSAKAEFTDKGFAKASLRSICKKAGVTTGALYFFFKDKDELFCEVVGELLEHLNTMIKEHHAFELEESQLTSGDFHDSTSDYEAMKLIVHELYQNREEVLLLLTGAQGSTMEHVTDRIVDMMDEHNAILCEAMCRANGVPMVDKKVVHWMSHSQIDMFIFMVTHIDNEKEAMDFAEKGMKYLLAGWYAIVKS